MPPERICLELLTPSALDTEREALAVLDAWRHSLPDFLPDKIGNFEPISTPFSANETETWLTAWKWPLLAKRSNARVQSSIFMRHPDRPGHSSWSMDLPVTDRALAGSVQLLKTAAVPLGVDFGCITLLGAREVRVGYQRETVHPLNREKTKFHFFISGPLLERRVPDLYWMTVLGEPLLSQIGRERISDAPVTKEWLGENQVVLQLTPSIEESRDDANFESLKDQLFAHLGIRTADWPSSH